MRGSTTKGETFHKEEHNNANEKEGHKEESSEEEITAAETQTDLRPSHLSKAFLIWRKKTKPQKPQTTRRLSRPVFYFVAFVLIFRVPARASVKGELAP
jgi:hypothetical protein